MVVMLPVLADVRADGRHVSVQPYQCSALVRLPVLLNIVLLGCKSNQRIPSYFEPHPPDILGLEGAGVLEVGPATTLALRPPFNDLAPLIVTPALRFKGVNSRRGGRHREEKLTLCLCASTAADAFPVTCTVSTVQFTKPVLS